MNLFRFCNSFKDLKIRTWNKFTLVKSVLKPARSISRKKKKNVSVQRFNDYFSADNAIYNRKLKTSYFSVLSIYALRINTLSMMSWFLSREPRIDNLYISLSLHSMYINWESLSELIRRNSENYGGKQVIRNQLISGVFLENTGYIEFRIVNFPSRAIIVEMTID